MKLCIVEWDSDPAHNTSKRGECLIIVEVQKYSYPSSRPHPRLILPQNSIRTRVRSTNERVALYPPEFMRVSDKKGEMTPETPPLKEFHFRRRIQLGVSVFKLMLESIQRIH